MGLALREKEGTWKLWSRPEENTYFLEMEGRKALSNLPNVAKKEDEGDWQKRAITSFLLHAAKNTVLHSLKWMHFGLTVLSS